jgi:glycine/sarcosine N-methyltransferase
MCTTVTPLRAELRSGKDRTILVVDDSDIVLPYVAGTLSSGGYTVRTAEDGHSALLEARAHLGPIHLLLTDYEMGAMNGFQLAAAVATERPETKVLVMSGRDRDEITLPENARFIQKPFSPAELLRSVFEILSTVAVVPEIPFQREPGNFNYSDEEALAFYNSVNPIYDFLFPNWRGIVQDQKAWLGALIERESAGVGKLRILDATAGIGTQAIALAQEGHTVTALDRSLPALSRARAEAAYFGVHIDCCVADMRDLTCISNQMFDVAVSMGNSVCVLQTFQEQILALTQVRQKLRRGGRFFVGIRDYRAAIRDRVSFDGPVVGCDSSGYRIAHQMWTWLDDRRYLLHIYLDRQSASGAWIPQVFRSVIRAILPDEIETALGMAGFTKVDWLGDIDHPRHNASENGFDELVLCAWAGKEIS